MPDRVLWVLRHAKTQRRPPNGGSDHDRRLDARGRADADALGHRLGDAGDRLGLDPALLPQIVLCSTAARAVETTERVLSQLSRPPVVTYLDGLYEASVGQVLQEVSRVEDTYRSVMTVGHNPTFELLVDVMAPDPVPAVRGGFATCGVVVFELPVASWRDTEPGTARVLGVFAPPY